MNIFEFAQCFTFSSTLCWRPCHSISLRDDLMTDALVGEISGFEKKVLFDHPSRRQVQMKSKTQKELTLVKYSAKFGSNRFRIPEGYVLVNNWRTENERRTFPSNLQSHFGDLKNYNRLSLIILVTKNDKLTLLCVRMNPTHFSSKIIVHGTVFCNCERRYADAVRNAYGRCSNALLQ